MSGPYECPRKPPIKLVLPSSFTTKSTKGTKKYQTGEMSYRYIPLRVLRDLRGLILRFLRRDFVADSRYRFFNVFPITESTEAKISFTGGAKA